MRTFLTLLLLVASVEAAAGHRDPPRFNAREALKEARVGQYSLPERVKVTTEEQPRQRYRCVETKLPEKDKRELRCREE